MVSGDPATPRHVGALRLVAAGKGVSLRYGEAWLADGFALSEDLPLVDIEHLPPGRLAADAQRAVGAVDDARPDRWGEKVIRFLDKPGRLSLWSISTTRVTTDLARSAFPGRPPPTSRAQGARCRDSTTRSG